MIIKRKRLLRLYCDQCQGIKWHDRLFSQGRHTTQDIPATQIPSGTILIYGRCVHCHHSQKYVSTQTNFDAAWFEVTELCRCSLPLNHDDEHLPGGWDDETVVYVCTVCSAEYPYGERCPKCEVPKCPSLRKPITMHACSMSAIAGKRPRGSTHRMQTTGVPARKRQSKRR